MNHFPGDTSKYMAVVLLLAGMLIGVLALVESEEIMADINPLDLGLAISGSVASAALVDEEFGVTVLEPGDQYDFGDTIYTPEVPPSEVATGAKADCTREEGGALTQEDIDTWSYSGQVKPKLGEEYYVCKPNEECIKKKGSPKYGPLEFRYYDEATKKNVWHLGCSICDYQLLFGQVPLCTCEK